MAHFDIPFQDKNSERMMLYRRIERICRDVQNRIYDQSVRLTGLSYCEGQGGADAPDEGDWQPFDDEGYWGARELYCRFRQRVTIPAAFAGREVMYVVDPMPDTEWESSAFQFILFVNGDMVQGMDHNHDEYLLSVCAEENACFDVVLFAYCDDHSYCGQAKLYTYLRTVDTAARDLYYDLIVPLETAHAYGADDLERVELLQKLNTAVSMLELHADRQTFDCTACAASAYLREHVFGQSMPVRVSAIGHTHIDVAWLWRLRQTREKAGRSFATVLQLMREYPQYRFMSSQAQLYDYVRQDYPEVFEQIRERVREGRWEAEGAMWVESDTNVISGESLVRQFLVGKRFFRDAFGVDNKIMWLPDVFGYSAALPQIMKLCGVEYFMTTKISWSEMDRLPFDTFLWQGIDGTKILSHFIPSQREHDASRGFLTTYTSDLDPNCMIFGWKRYANKDLNRSWLCAFGHGDGGGGPTRLMLEKGKRLAEGVPGCPRAEQEFARTFFDRLSDEVRGNPHLPVWHGELYLEFHRGTLTSQSRNKRYNRKSEFLMHDCETLAEMAHDLLGADYPAQTLLEDWKLILLNQFHDIIPGSSIRQVYDDSKAQYEQVLSSGHTVCAQATAALTGAMTLSQDSVVVFNTLGFARSDLAQIDMPDGEYTFLDIDGSVLPSQRTVDGKLLFLAKNVPAKGYKAFRIARTGNAAGDTVQVTDKRFETPFFIAVFDDKGNIASLMHKQSGRAVAPDGETLNRLIAFEDRPNVYEAWDVKVYYDEKSWDVDDVQSAEVVEHGPVRTVYRVTRRFRSSTIRQDFIFYPSIERIDVQYRIDWHEKNVLLKADYPVDVNAARATYDIQFGNLERSTHNNTTWDFAKFEACGHKWADLSDNGFGLAVLNDCKYGWNIKQGHIRPSILRCATQPNTEQDREVHEVTFALYPHAGAVDTSGVVQEGYKLNVPLLAVMAPRRTGALPDVYSFVSADRDNVILETLKKAEDSDALILRTYETWNRSTDCTIRFAKPIREAYITNLMEEQDEPLSTDGRCVRLRYKPFEIISLKVVLE